MEAEKTLPSWLNNEAQENPLVSVYWPRRQFPVVYHKALIPGQGLSASLEKLQKQTNQIHRGQSMGAGGGHLTPLAAG